LILLDLDAGLFTSLNFAQHGSRNIDFWKENTNATEKRKHMVCLGLSFSLQPYKNKNIVFIGLQEHNFLQQ
jgi:hypothetical protein